MAVRTTYLERYMAGEYEPVWTELVALRAAVRAEPLYTDALAVARETMRRVRYNIETLIPRLETLGYVFGYGWVDPDEDTWAKANPPPFSAPPRDVEARLLDFERRAGVLPLALRAFYEEVGGVNFVGTPPEDWADTAWWHEPLRSDGDPDAKRYGLDPLFVYPFEEVEACQHGLGEPGKPFAVPIAPDHLMKFHISGLDDYTVKTPNAAIDARLRLEWHRTTFVNYLRICFRWGGFPGFERYSQPPLADIVRLREGLLPL